MLLYNINFSEIKKIAHNIKSTFICKYIVPSTSCCQCFLLRTHSWTKIHIQYIQNSREFWFQFQGVSSLPVAAAVIYKHVPCCYLHIRKNTLCRLSSINHTLCPFPFKPFLPSRYNGIRAILCSPFFSPVTIFQLKRKIITAVNICLFLT